MNGEKTLNVGWDLILKVSVLVIFLYFLYLIQGLVVGFIFALIISILFNFTIDLLEKKKIPRVVATVIVYVGVLAIVSFFFYQTVPLFIDQVRAFTSNLPQYFQKVSPYLEKVGINIFQGADSFVSFIENNIGQAGEGVLSALVTIFGGVGTTIFIIFLSFFFSLEPNLLERLLSNFSPSRYKEYLFNLLPRVKKKVSGWFVSRIVGIVFVGLLSYVALLVLDVNYSFILALIFGVSDFVPIVGPLVGTIIVVLAVSLDSLTKALLVLISFVVIQQLENNLLFPLIFKRFIGVPPALVLIALAVGAELWGLLGAILAVPLAGIIFEIIKDYAKRKKRRDEAVALES